MRQAGDGDPGPGLSRRQSPSRPGAWAVSDRASAPPDDERPFPSPSRGAGRHRTTGGSAGKGPLRGFPPAPGQPPPLYPPGEFSAWNRRYRRDGSPAGEAAGTVSAWQAPSRAEPAPERGREDALRSQRRAATGYPEPEDSSPGSSRPGYRGRGDPAYGADDSEPGYSALAVSEPAADVISTQSWEAVDDEPPAGWSTQTAVPGYRAPRPDYERSRPDYEPGRPETSPGYERGRPQPRADYERGRPEPRPGYAARDRSPAPPPAEPAGTRGPGARLMAGGPPERTGGGTAQRAAGRAPDAGQRAGNAAAGTATGPGRARSHGQGTRGRGRRRAKRRTVILAGGLAVAVVVGVTVYLLASGNGQAPAAPTAPQAATRKSSPASPAPSASLGQWGYIASRTTDPVPLSLTELFPAQFTSGGMTYSMTADKANTQCSPALIGTALQSAASQAGCTQAMSASYLSGDQQVMGTIGVLNLAGTDGAESTGKAAGPSEFIAQLPGPSGPTKSLGTGTGLEAAEVKGHYLVLVWAEFANLKAPTSTAQQQQLEAFINLLITKTANVSLASREVTGKPAA